MRNLKRNLALVGSTAVIAAAGLGGVMGAQADTSSTPGTDQAEAAQEGAEVEDGPNEGPDANPNEPGHQDADESGEAEGAESGEAEDGPNQGADANPNEPGHQDADESGETE